MNESGWQDLQFERFLTPDRRPYDLAPDEDADLVGMRLYGAGPFHREHKEAMRIRKKSHFLIRKGDVIYNKLFAWKGAFGIVPPELDGMLVSDKFPTYELDRTQVDAGYLAWFFRWATLWDEARDLSTGSAALSKLTLNPPRFLRLKIRAPSVPDQRRIAKRLSALHSRVALAFKFRYLASRESAALFRSYVSKTLASLPVDGTLSQVFEGPPKNGWSPRCDNEESGTPVLTLSAVTGFDYDRTSFKRTSEFTDPQARYWLAAGDLLMTRSNTQELVGHAAIYDGHPSPCVYPDLVMRLNINDRRADKRFVWMWLQTIAVRDYIEEKARGTNPTMKKINKTIVSNIPFPVGIDVPHQIRLVTQLDEFRERVAGLRELQFQSVAEIKGLVPAIVNHTFERKL